LNFAAFSKDLLAVCVVILPCRLVVMCEDLSQSAVQHAS